MTRSKNLEVIIQKASHRPFLLGLSIRIIAMIVLPWLLDDTAVKYTDIDYNVFTDAARYIQQGKSPYQRLTYRYTPYLAWILSFATKTSPMSSSHMIVQPNYSASLLWKVWRHPKYFGRLIFCLSDSLCGLLILKRRQIYRKNMNLHNSPAQCNDTTQLDRVYDALWWLWNPLPINICTRGSAESFIVLLPLLSSLHIASYATHCHESTCYRKLWVVASLSGILHGLAVHTKLYPLIYTLSFMVFFSCQENPLDSKPFMAPPIRVHRCLKFVQMWCIQLMTSFSSILFLFFSIITFSFLTIATIQQYGMVAVQEGLLYHFSRIDHRHNYSIYWYWFYLYKARSIQILSFNTDTTWIQNILSYGQSIIFSLPQISLILVSSFGIAPFDLSFCLFIQTFLFVAQNKVITAQYFTWYLCLLPLCSHGIFSGPMTNSSTKPQWKWTFSIIVLVASILHWLGVAFCVEMMGKPMHLYLWVASIFFYLAHLLFGSMILRNYTRRKIL